MKAPINPAVATQVPSEVPGLLVRCLVGDADAARACGRKGLWEYLAAEACDCGVGVVLLDRLEAMGSAVSPSARRQLQTYAEFVLARSRFQTDAVRPVLVALAAEGIDHILLKGAALDGLLYAPGRRPMSDIDVLIRPADTQRADAVLRSCGCRRGPDLLRADFYPRYYYEREYHTPGVPGVKIDLHCRPFRLPRYAHTMADGIYLHDTRPASYAGLAIRVPSPANLLIHLAVHAAIHGCRELRWLLDIRLLLDAANAERWPNPDLVGRRAREWRLGWPLRRALLSVRKTFGPHDLLDQCLAATPAVAGPLDVLAVAAAPLCASAPAISTAADCLCIPGLANRVRYAAAVLLPDRGHLGQLYARRHFGWPLVAHLRRLAWVR